MADIEKVMSVEDADIEKFMGVARADIEKIMGVEMPSLANAWQGDRGVFGGGYSGSAYVNVMDYISIASLHNHRLYRKRTGFRRHTWSCWLCTRSEF